MEEGVSFDVIYLDLNFRKAFNSMPHERLLVKLKSYGINRMLFNWIIKDFLNDQLQYVFK